MTSQRCPKCAGFISDAEAESCFRCGLDFGNPALVRAAQHARAAPSTFPVLIAGLLTVLWLPLVGVCVYLLARLVRDSFIHYAVWSQTADGGQVQEREA